MYAKPRLPDPVRTAAVRAVLIVALTLVMVLVAVLCSLAEVWFALPAVLAAVAATVVATWGVLDVWITRQVWNQRHGVHSEPSSAARARRTQRAGPGRGVRSAQEKGPARESRPVRECGPPPGDAGTSASR